MSGHSKWATIHRQKEAKDSKRGAAFTRLAQAIVVAVRSGGGIGEPEKNFKLRLAVEKARAANMPKENIKRAIEKGMGGGDGSNLVEVTFEGFLPGNVGVLVDVVTDNKLRTAQQVREIVDKNGGNMASAGAVAYQFVQLGEIRVVNKSLTDVDELTFIDAGAMEIEKDNDEWRVVTSKDDLASCGEKINQLGYQVIGMDLTKRPNGMTVEVDEETAVRIEQIVAKLEDLDDVTHVWINY
jgi:YebC/PmpR family DNA-binding regulatory protein